MTPKERRRIVLELIASRLADEAAQQSIQRSYIAFGRVSQPTVFNVLKAKNYTIGTLVEILDALDLEITITKRSA